MLGPFSIDTYLPAFTGIARRWGHAAADAADAVGLPVRLRGMNLFHGALADSFGRRPVVLWGIAVFTLASVGCALSPPSAHAGLLPGAAGLSAGAGIVVSRAVIRDMFPPAEAQRVMSQVTIYFGVAPAVAPMVGGWLFVHADWHAIFWFLAGRRRAAVDGNWRCCPRPCTTSASRSMRAPAARLLAAGVQPALPGAGAGQRHPVQRHVPVRAVGAGVPGRAPASWRRRSSSGSSC
jgi:DHA1 family bicyclomycin/chloramphenicol resistance-like MFS transporter